jgi:hypothetical protein
MRRTTHMLIRDKDHRCDALICILLRNRVENFIYNDHENFDQTAVKRQLSFPLLFHRSFASPSVRNAPLNSSRDSWLFASHARVRCRFYIHIGLPCSVRPKTWSMDVSTHACTHKGRWVLANDAGTPIQMRLIKWTRHLLSRCKIYLRVNTDVMYMLV